MDWQKLISNKRLGQEDRHALRHDDRSEFKRDSDRLIYSAPFRRLQNKTQVFPSQVVSLCITDSLTRLKWHHWVSLWATMWLEN